MPNSESPSVRPTPRRAMAPPGNSQRCWRGSLCLRSAEAFTIQPRTRSPELARSRFPCRTRVMLRRVGSTNRSRCSRAKPRLPALFSCSFRARSPRLGLLIGRAGGTCCGFANVRRLTHSLARAVPTCRSSSPGVPPRAANDQFFSARRQRSTAALDRPPGGDQSVYASVLRRCSPRSGYAGDNPQSRA
jgi:hypothetical protein